MAAKLRGRYSEFPYTIGPHRPTASPTINIPITEVHVLPPMNLALTRHYAYGHPESIVHIRVDTWCLRPMVWINV